MRAGALRHRVVVKEPTELADAMGQRILTFEPNATRYASIAPLKQEERVEADKVKGVRTHKITMRHHGTITSRWRIEHNGRTFDVDGIINPDERNVSTEAICVEVD